MNARINVSSVAILLASCIAAILAWLDKTPGPLSWSIRVGAPILAVLMMVDALLKLHAPPDVVPDYLYKRCGSFFNCDGLCFVFEAADIGGVCHLIAIYQNQFDQPCSGKIVLQPRKRLFSRHPDANSVVFKFECAPAEFGYLRVPISLRKHRQGKRQSYEVSAEVRYPQGKGTKLRFREGTRLETAGLYAKITTVIGMLLGMHLPINTPANVTLRLPKDVAMIIPGHSKREHETLWRQGDPPLTNFSS